MNTICASQSASVSSTRTVTVYPSSSSLSVYTGACPGFVMATVVQVRFQAKDQSVLSPPVSLATVTATVTATADRLGTGAKVGLGVGVQVVILLLVAIIVGILVLSS